jgi:hypothetical protein
MTGKILLPSNHFDYEAVAKRLRQAELNRQPPRQLGPMYAFSGRARSRRASAPPQQRRVSALSRLKTALREEKKQLVVASLVLLGFATWLGSSAQALYAQHVEALLADSCQKNQLNHAAEAYCFDARRLVYTLNPDGTATKPGLDWRVNENAHRKAEAASAREARAAAGDPQ